MENSDIIYVVTHCGGPNYGDEIIPYLWLKNLSVSYPDKKIFVDTFNPNQYAMYLGWEFKNVTFVNTFFLVRSLIKERQLDFLTCDSFIEELITYGSPEININRGIDILKTVDSIHFVGGGYINGVVENFRLNYCFLTLASQVKKLNPALKLFATGLGISPVPSDYIVKLNEVVKEFDYFEVRDMESSVALPDSVAGFDDMFLAFNDMKDFGGGLLRKNVSESLPKINLLLQSDLQDRSKLEEFLDSFNEYILENYSQDERILFIESTIWDHEVFEVIRQKLLNPIEIYDPLDLLIKGFPAREGSVWFTTRFHFHLVGAALGMKGVFIRTGGEYYDIKHTSLLKLGTGWNDYSVTGKILPTVSNEFSAVARELGNKKYELFKEIYEGITATSSVETFDNSFFNLLCSNYEQKIAIIEKKVMEQQMHIEELELELQNQELAGKYEYLLFLNQETEASLKNLEIDNKALETELTRMNNTVAFKLGHALLTPAYWIYDLIKGKK